MEQKTILLVEDNFLNRRLCRKVLAENGYRVLEAKNVAEALVILKKEQVDLAVLDINLGEEETTGGISIGYELTVKYAVPFVYLTAYDNSKIVTQAVATTPYAYLTKPFKNTDLLTTVTLAIGRAQAETDKPSILVKDGTFSVNLPLEDIDFIESEGNYLWFHVGEKRYKCRSTIKQLLESLPEKMFIQTHRAFVVNKTKITKFSNSWVVVNEETIPVSRNYLDDIDILL